MFCHIYIFLDFFLFQDQPFHCDHRIRCIARILEQPIIAIRLLHHGPIHAQQCVVRIQHRQCGAIARHKCNPQRECARWIVVVVGCDVAAAMIGGCDDVPNAIRINDYCPDERRKQKKNVLVKKCFNLKTPNFSINQFLFAFENAFDWNIQFFSEKFTPFFFLNIRNNSFWQIFFDFQNFIFLLPLKKKKCQPAPCQNEQSTIAGIILFRKWRFSRAAWNSNIAKIVAFTCQTIFGIFPRRRMPPSFFQVAVEKFANLHFFASPFHPHLLFVRFTKCGQCTVDFHEKMLINTSRHTTRKNTNFAMCSAWKAFGAIGSGGKICFFFMRKKRIFKKN